MGCGGSSQLAWHPRHRAAGAMTAEKSTEPAPVTTSVAGSRQPPPSRAEHLRVAGRLSPSAEQATRRRRRVKRGPARLGRDYARCPASGAEERMSISRHRCLSAWGPSRHAPSFGAPVITRWRRANGHPQFFTGARNVPHHARGRPFPRCRRHRPVVIHDLPRLLGTAPRGVVSPQRHPHRGQATIHPRVMGEHRDASNMRRLDCCRAVCRASSSGC